MINPKTQEDISIKTQLAHEAGEAVLKLCVEYSKDQNKKHLKMMGGYLGVFVNNLRSMLNYASVDYCEQRKFSKTSKGKKLNTDFPYGTSEKLFNNIELVKLIRKADPKLFDFLESIQPYNPKQNTIGNIMKISNMDKHENLVDALNMDITSVIFPNSSVFSPQHLGSAVLLGFKDNQPVLVKTPAYIPEIRMFALSNKTFINFMIPMGESYLELIPFVHNAGKHVVDVVNKFYKLWK